MQIAKAFYVKLGEGGLWEKEALATGKLRLGWTGQSLGDINAGNWEKIRGELQLAAGDRRGVATTDLRRLRDIADSGPDDVWITFSAGTLWWTRLAQEPMHEDEVSKYRSVMGGWSCTNTKGRPLVISELPGGLAAKQAFRGTVCSVEKTQLARVLSGELSPESKRIGELKEALCAALRDGIQQLHWKDFETLVDLVFSASGWQRVSILGGTEKGYDLDLREPITGRRFLVQVKSKAGLAEVEEMARFFADSDAEQLFFVVHLPKKDLTSAQLPPNVLLVDPLHLARMVADAGLAGWVQDKIS